MYGLLIALLLAALLQDGTYKISGAVVREDKQDPVQAPQSNQILLSGANMSMIINVGAGGAFEFPNVRPGTYQLVVGPRTIMTPVSVTVTDKDLGDVRLLVPPTPGVNGVVNVDGGGPRPRFQVSFTRTDAATSTPAATTAPPFNVALQPGQYRVAATGFPAGYTLKSLTMGNVDLLQQPLTVTAGTAHYLTFSLAVSSPPPWVRVSGIVTGGAAKQVTMSGTPTTETLTADVGPKGAFEFSKVLPGSYTIRTIPTVPIATPVPVTVSSTDLANVEVRIPASKEITGRITLRGNVPMPPRLTLSLTPTTGGAGVNLVATPGLDGAFKLTLPEGERQITVVPSSIPAGHTLESFSYGSTDLLKNPLRVASADTSQLLITLDGSNIRPRNVSGRVNGLLTTQGVRVVLTGGSLGPGVESPVAADGSFAFTDVPPGSYAARLSLSGPVIQTAVRVDNQDVTGVTITFPRRFVVAAHILVEGDEGVNPAPPVVLEARSAAGAVVTSTALTTAGSPMQLVIADGEHRISLRGIPPGYRQKSLRYGTTDLQESPLKVDGPITWEIIVRLERIRN